MNKKATQFQINILYRDGYHAAAKIIEDLTGTISRDAEWSYMLDFCGEIYGTQPEDAQVEFDQLRSLWTAFCLHQDLDVDTGTYDAFLQMLWVSIEGHEQGDFDEFDQFMAQMLV